MLAAVVDRISFPPRNILEDTDVRQEEASHGSDGFSVLIADSQQTAPSLWTPERLDDGKQDLRDEQPCSLSFRFSSEDAFDHSQNVDKPSTVYNVDLPLANTIFQNGKTSTMIAQRWSFDWNIKPRPDLIHLRHNLIQQQSICMPYANRDAEQLIKVPRFRRLTAPRVISDSMGNIIRSLQFSHKSASTIPASKELENCLGAWTSDQVNAHEIWAHLTPRERWSDLPQIMDDPSDVERGSRLHKVLSGGGGWGNKQGLISLDPSLRVENSSAQSVFNIGQGIEREQRDVLGEIARPGDVVQFYAFEQSSSPHPFEPPKAMNILTPHTFTFGNMTAQQDTMPNATVSKGIDHRHLFVHGHFGALSESGISLEVQLSLAGATSYGGQNMGTVVQTKLPPRSSFSWRVKRVPS